MRQRVMWLCTVTSLYLAARLTRCMCVYVLVRRCSPIPLQRPGPVSRQIPQVSRGVAQRPVMCMHVKGEREEGERGER
jgi:hypothetical protein